MNEESFDLGDPILFMKVGTHANEPLEEIIERKQQEICDAGFAMWGYGGNTCHPRTMVRPFAAAHGHGKPIRLVMEPMESKHFAEQVRADEYSPDGIQWREVPHGINVLGSRHALCIGNLRQVDLELDLAETTVAVGNSQGRSGRDYVQGRVDKACLEVVGPSEDSRAVKIGLVADLVAPFAVFLRNLDPDCE